MSFDWAVAIAEVATLRASIWAFGTAAPVASVTVPVMVARNSCPSRAEAASRRARAIFENVDVDMMVCDFLSEIILGSVKIHSFSRCSDVS